MHRRLATRLARALRVCALWCLVIAIPVYGLSGTIVQLLGESHFHRAPAVAASPHVAVRLQDFRRTGAPAPDAGSFFQRHHHAAPDPSVVTVGGREDDSPADGSVSSAGGACQVFASCDASSLARPGFVRIAWREAADAELASGPAHRLERPPKA